MKKIILVFVLFFSMISFSQEKESNHNQKKMEPVVKHFSYTISANISPRLKLNNSNKDYKFNPDNYFSLGIEKKFTKSKVIKYGVGLKFNTSINTESLGASVKNMLYYLFFESALINKEYSPSVFGALGYNFVKVDNKFENESDGLYYSVGLSVRLSELVGIRVLYSTDFFKTNYMNERYLGENSYLSMGFIIN